MLMLSDKRATLATFAYEQTKRLKALHRAFPEKRTYPRDERFTSAIYDIEYRRIFSLNRTEPADFFKEIDMQDGYIRYIKDLDVFYLGARYLVIEVPDDGIWAEHARRNILFFGGSAVLILGFIGFFLAKLFVKPMRDAILLLDRFVADTTHELNTPLSTILANIETIDPHEVSPPIAKKLSRIAAAAKSVSVLYRDLTYLVLEKEHRTHKEATDMLAFVRRRVEYFATLTQNKKITVICDVHPCCLMIDPKDAERLFDNLFSNAVKYNKKGGTVRIVLNKEALCVEDTGIGIDTADIPLLFDRYMRFHTVQGGFGVGLSIVKEIVDRYGWRIDVDSQKGKGTRFCIVWKKEDQC
jgi:two-component system OmpR family sensor kinase